MTVDPVARGGLPTEAEVRTYLGLSADALTDDDLGRMWEAVIQDQVNVCHVPTDGDGNPDRAAWPTPLSQAALRRMQREVATRGLPLGYLDVSGEFGPARISGYDAMIENHENPYRRAVVA